MHCPYLGLRQPKLLCLVRVPSKSHGWCTGTCSSPQTSTALVINLQSLLSLSPLFLLLLPPPSLPPFCLSFFSQTPQCSVSLSLFLLMIPPSCPLPLAFQSCLPTLSSILLLPSNTLFPPLSFQVLPSQSFSLLTFLPPFSCLLAFFPSLPLLCSNDLLRFFFGFKSASF